MVGEKNLHRRQRGKMEAAECSTVLGGEPATDKQCAPLPTTRPWTSAFLLMWLLTGAASVHMMWSNYGRHPWLAQV